MAPLLQLRTLAAFVLVIACTWIVGRIVVTRFKSSTGDRLTDTVWQFAVGLVACGMVLTALGFLGLLYRPVIVGATIAVACLGGLLQFLRASRAVAGVAPRLPSRGDCECETLPPAWLRGLLMGLCAMAVLGSLASALAPPTAGDALCYHLELPKRFLQEHRFTLPPDNDNATYPLLAEMWFMWGLAIDGGTTSQLLHWWCGLLTAGAAYVAARPLVGGAWAQVAGAIVLLTPGINSQMTAPLNDTAMALCAALAVAAWLEGDLRSPRDAARIGLMLGAASAVKFTGLLFAGCLVAVIALEIAVRAVDRRTVLAAGVACLLAAAVVAGPWYLRAAVYRGDPVYPFLSHHGASDGPATFPESKAPLGRSPLAVLAAPWHLTMSPERFGGRAHELGPLWLMFAPFGLLIAKSRRVVGMAAVAMLYGASCLMLRQNVRFLLPLVPLGAVGVAAVWSRLVAWPVLPRVVVLATASAVLLSASAAAVHRARDRLAVAVGIESHDDYLARAESTFAAARWANDHLPADAHVLSQEHRAFYFDARMTRENIFRRRTAYDQAVAAATESLGNRLRDAGFTHVLLAEVEGSNYSAYDATLSRLVDAETAADPDRAPVSLCHWKTCDADGVARRYRLLELR